MRCYAVVGMNNINYLYIIKVFSSESDAIIFTREMNDKGASETPIKSYIIYEVPFE